jgi:hypothetical protein
MLEIGEKTSPQESPLSESGAHVEYLAVFLPVDLQDLRMSIQRKTDSYW